jgi:hypothetical protein
VKSDATAAAVLAILALAAAARTDEWDVGSDPDNGILTDNLLHHGAEQVHDLAALGPGVPDQDWYFIQGHQFSSYQILIEGLTGDLDFGTGDVQILNSLGNVIAHGGELSSGRLISVQQFRDGGDHYLRVQGAACGSSCTSQARYRVRFYDTTYTVPRFNNSGSQSTVLLLLNTSDAALCFVDAHYFDDAGVRLLVRESQIRAKELAVIPLASIPELAGTSGSIRLVHGCGYGGLSGKAVSLEPSTGFTFETPLVARPH